MALIIITIIICAIYLFIKWPRESEMSQYYRIQADLLRNPIPETESQKSCRKAYEDFMRETDPMYQIFKHQNWAANHGYFDPIILLAQLGDLPKDETKQGDKPTT